MSITLNDVGHSAWIFAKTAGTYTCQRLQALGEWAVNHKWDIIDTAIGIGLIVTAAAIVCFSFYGLMALLTLPSMAGVGELGMIAIDLSALFLGMPLAGGIGIVVAGLGIFCITNPERRKQLQNTGKCS